MRQNSNRGFAAMDAQKRREIASKGGKASHQKGTGHEFTSEEARVAGRKGGVIVSQDRAHMARIGREGGRARKGARQAAVTNSQTQENVFHEPNVETNEQLDQQHPHQIGA